MVQVMQDLKVVSATLRSPKPCSAGERRALVVARVKAKLHARSTDARLQHLSEEVPHIFPSLDGLFENVVLLGHEPGTLTKSWRFGACR